MRDGHYFLSRTGVMNVRKIFFILLIYYNNLTIKTLL